MALGVPTVAPALSLKDKLAGLPSAEQAFGSKQRVDNARGLKEPDRHQLKLQFEALAAEHGLRVNDVVDHFGLHRHTYWYFIDTAKPGPSLPDTKERRSRTSVLDLPAADQLQLLAKVKELINPLGGNLDLNIACVEAGLTITQYYSLERRRDELRAKADESNIDELDITPVKGAPEIGDDVMRLRVHDATTLLSFATRQRLDQAARMLGIQAGDIAEWRKVLGFTPVLEGNSGQKLPLARERLQLEDPGKVRVVRGLEYLQAAVGADAKTVAKVLGFHRMTIEAWFRNAGKMEEQIAKEAATAKAETERAAAEKAKPAQPAAKVFAEADADTLRLYGVLECANAAVMHPTQLVGLWRAAKARGGGDGAAMNELLLYYVPVLDQAIRRTSGSEMAHRIDETKLRGYAHPGLWQAIREHRLSETRQFVPFAVAMATTALRDELRGDNMGTSDIARSAQARLRNATQRWFRRNKKAERMPSPQELADIMHVSMWEVCDMIEITHRATVSLQAPVGEHGDGELGMLLEDETVEAPDADDAGPAAEPMGLNGVTGDLLATLSADNRRFIETFYLNGSMPQAAALLGLNEARGWALHHSIMSRLRREAARRPEFALMQRRFELYGDGRPQHLAPAMTADLETTAEFAPQLIELATRWVPYALAHMEPDELAEALQDEYAEHTLMDSDVTLPEIDNREAFYRVALLVLRNETAAVA